MISGPYAEDTMQCGLIDPQERGIHGCSAITASVSVDSGESAKDGVYQLRKLFIFKAHFWDEDVARNAAAAKVPERG